MRVGLAGGGGEKGKHGVAKLCVGEWVGVYLCVWRSGLQKEHIFWWDILWIYFGLLNCSNSVYKIVNQYWF